MRAFLDVTIFDQSSGLLWCAGTKIQTHEGRGSNGMAPGHEFVGSKLIGFDGIPCLVQHPRAVFLGPHTIQPVITRHKISAGIANDGHTEVFHFVQDVLAETIGIGKFRAGIVNPTVNRAAKVFQK